MEALPIPTRSKGDTALHSLVSYDYSSDEAVTDELISGTDPNIRNANGQTALHHAVQCAYFHGITELLRYAANPNISDHSGRFPIHIAAMLPSYSVEVIQMLYDYDCEIDVYDNNGLSPLHFASIIGNSEAIQLLSSFGCNINARTDEGDSPLHLAVAGVQEECVGTLLALGANYNIRGSDGLLTTELAEKCPFPAIRRIFSQYVNNDSGRRNISRNMISRNTFGGSRVDNLNSSGSNHQSDHLSGFRSFEESRSFRGPVDGKSRGRYVVPSYNEGDDTQYENVARMFRNSTDPAPSNAPFVHGGHPVFRSSHNRSSSIDNSMLPTPVQRRNNLTDLFPSSNDINQKTHKSLASRLQAFSESIPIAPNKNDYDYAGSDNVFLSPSSRFIHSEFREAASTLVQKKHRSKRGGEAADFDNTDLARTKSRENGADSSEYEDDTIPNATARRHERIRSRIDFSTGSAAAMPAEIDEWNVASRHTSAGIREDVDPSSTTSGFGGVVKTISKLPGLLSSLVTAVVEPSLTLPLASSPSVDPTIEEERRRFNDVDDDDPDHDRVYGASASLRGSPTSFDGGLSLSSSSQPVIHTAGQIPAATLISAIPTTNSFLQPSSSPLIPSSASSTSPTQFITDSNRLASGLAAIRVDPNLAQKNGTQPSLTALVPTPLPYRAPITPSLPRSMPESAPVSPRTFPNNVEPHTSDMKHTLGTITSSVRTSSNPSTPNKPLTSVSWTAPVPPHGGPGPANLEEEEEEDDLLVAVDTETLKEVLCGEAFEASLRGLAPSQLRALARRLREELLVLWAAAPLGAASVNVTHEEGNLDFQLPSMEPPATPKRPLSEDVIETNSEPTQVALLPVECASKDVIPMDSAVVGEPQQCPFTPDVAQPQVPSTPILNSSSTSSKKMVHLSTEIDEENIMYSPEFSKSATSLSAILESMDKPEQDEDNLSAKGFNSGEEHFDSNVDDSQNPYEISASVESSEVPIENVVGSTSSYPYSSRSARNNFTQSDGEIVDGEGLTEISQKSLEVWEAFFTNMAKRREMMDLQRLQQGENKTHSQEMEDFEEEGINE